MTRERSPLPATVGDDSETALEQRLAEVAGQVELARDERERRVSALLAARRASIADREARIDGLTRGLRSLQARDERTGEELAELEDPRPRPVVEASLVAALVILLGALAIMVARDPMMRWPLLGLTGLATTLALFLRRG